MPTKIESNPRFEIINGKWIKRIDISLRENDTIAVKIDAIKSIVCFSNLVFNKNLFWICLKVGSESDFKIEYKQTEQNEYLRDKKILEDLLFNQI
jgi:hypothetical protein